MASAFALLVNAFEAMASGIGQFLGFSAGDAGRRARERRIADDDQRKREQDKPHVQQIEE